MGFDKIEYKDKSKDVEILNNSARIAAEFIAEENQRGESANNRANFAIGIVGIYASILLGLQDFFGLCVFRHIRTAIPETSGHETGSIRTLCRLN